MMQCDDTAAVCNIEQGATVQEGVSIIDVDDGIVRHVPQNLRGLT